MAVLFLDGFARATTAEFVKLTAAAKDATTAFKRWRRVSRKNTRRRRGTHRLRVEGK